MNLLCLSDDLLLCIAKELLAKFLIIRRQKTSEMETVDINDLRLDNVLQLRRVCKKWATLIYDSTNHSTLFLDTLNRLKTFISFPLQPTQGTLLHEYMNNFRQLTYHIDLEIVETFNNYTATSSLVDMRFPWYAHEPDKTEDDGNHLYFCGQELIDATNHMLPLLTNGLSLAEQGRSFRCLVYFVRIQYSQEKRWRVYEGEIDEAALGYDDQTEENCLELEGLDVSPNAFHYRQTFDKDTSNEEGQGFVMLVTLYLNGSFRLTTWCEEDQNDNDQNDDDQDFILPLLRAFRWLCEAPYTLYKDTPLLDCKAPVDSAAEGRRKAIAKATEKLLAGNWVRPPTAAH
jgi:hypothetical protein